MYIGKVLSVRGPDRLGLVARRVADLPGQAGRQVDFPEIESAVTSVRRIHNTLAVRVPRWLVIVEFAVADVAARAFVDPIQPELLLIVVTQLVNDRRAVRRPAWSTRGLFTACNSLRCSTVRRDDPDLAKQIDNHFPVMCDINREIGSFRQRDLSLRARRAD